MPRHKRMLVIGLFAVLHLVRLPQVDATTVTWSALDRAVALADGTNGVPVGDLVRIGYFDIVNSQIAANPTNLVSLDTHFFEFASGAMGDGTGIEGTFSESSNNSGTNFSGQAIHIWVLNAASLGAATQHGVFDAPSNSNWTFPSFILPTTVDLGDAGVTAVIGSLGGAVTVSNFPIASSAVLASTSTITSPTNDVLQYAVLKGHAFSQPGVNVPEASTNSPFEFFSFVDAVSSGTVTAARVLDPNSVTHTLTNSLATLRFQFSDSFTTNTDLDAAYSNATYQLTITTVHGTLTPSVTLTNDNYPTAPHITNWTTLQSVNPTSTFTVAWDAFTGGTTNDFVQLSIDDSLGSNVFATSSDFLDPARLTGASTSTIVPSNTLLAGQTYQAELMFVKVTSLDTNSIADSAGIGGFFSATDFRIRTANAGLLQFSAATYGVGEGSGMATITVVRAGNTNGTVGVSYAASNGTAIAPDDYSAVNGMLTFVDGQTSATFTVPIIDDSTVEGAETVNLTLSTPTGGASLGGPARAVLTILDNDTTPGATRLDFLQGRLDDILECLANVSLTLLASDRDSATAEMDDCIAAVEDLIAEAQAQETIDALGVKAAAGLQRRFASLLKKMLAAQNTLGDPRKTDAKALKALMKTNALIAKTQRTFIKFKTQAPFVVLEERRGKGGFYGANEFACYRIHVLDLAKGANCGPGTITVSNLADSVGLDVVLDAVIIKSATDFCVITGEDQGAARVTVTACERSSSLILINVGPPP